MTVAELITALQKQDPERLVVCYLRSGDASPLSSIQSCAYEADSTWMGEIGLESLTAKDIAAGYDEEDVVDGVPALALHPTA